jgi:DNA topoisomerase-1
LPPVVGFLCDNKIIHGPAESDADAKRNLVAAIKETAQTLGNTAAVCRKAYLHPAVVAASLDGSLVAKLNGRKTSTRPPSMRGLYSDEAAVLRFLKRAGSGRNGRCRVK